MKKVLSIVAVIAFAASVATASMTRISGLGIDGWMIEDDDSLAQGNPADIVNYSGNLWGEWNGGTSAAFAASGWGGLSGDLGLMDITGALFIGQGYQGNIGSMGNAAAGSDVATAANMPAVGTPMDTSNVTGKYLAMVGMPLSNMNVGISLNVASDSDSENEDDVSKPSAAAFDTKYEAELGASDMGINLGVIMDDMDPLTAVEGVLSLNMIGVDNSFSLDTHDGTSFVNDTDYTFESDNGMNMGINVRAIKEKSSGSKLIAMVGYEKDDLSSVANEKVDANLDGDVADAGDTDQTITREDTGSEISLGLAVNKMTSEKTLMIAAIGANLTSETVNATLEDNRSINNGVTQEYNREAKGTQIPVNLGVERMLSDLATLRLGLDTIIYDKSTVTVDDPDYGVAGTLTGQTDTESTSDNTTGNTTLTVGLGLNIMEDLKIDALMSQELLVGQNNIFDSFGEELASQMTATWKY